MIDELLSYAGKRVIVFGGGGAGMGAAVTSEVAALGGEVHVVDLKEPPVEVASHHATDLRDPAAIDAVLADVGAPVHSIFYCAGLPGPPFAAEDVMTVNFLAARHVSQAAAPYLADGASMSSISSGAGMGWMLHMEPIFELLKTDSIDAGRKWCADHPDLVADGYALSKEVIIVWTMQASVALAEQRGIRLNCISPGCTDTPMMPKFIDNMGSEFFDNFPRPLGRNSTPAEQAYPMVFLNSDAASYVSGANLFTDGAFSAGAFTGQFTMAPPEPATA